MMFIILYKVTLNFDSLNEILNSDHANESYLTVLSIGAVFTLYKVGLDFDSVDKIGLNVYVKGFQAIFSRGTVYYAIIKKRLYILSL